MDLRVAAERVRLVLGRRLAGDFLVALRRVAAADLLPPVERFAFARLVVVLPRLAVVFRLPAVGFFVLARLLRLRGFVVVPVTASAMLVAALETPSVIVSRTDVPSFSLSMLSSPLVYH